MTALTFASLGTTLAIDVAIMLAIVCVFNFLRTLKLTCKFYSPKRFLYVPFRYRPPKLSASFFTWWTPLFKLSEGDMIACAGQDAVTYINFLSLGLKLSFIVGLLTIIVILPVNAAAGNNLTCNTAGCSTPQGSNFTYVDFTTLANIANKSNLLWIHTIAVYVISAIVMKMLWQSQAHAVTLRIRYLASTPGGAQTHTILVQNIPGTRAGTFNQRVYDNMDGFLGKFIPKKVKDRARQAIEGGVQAAGTVAARVPLHRRGGIDDPLNVYLSPSASPHSADDMQSAMSRNFDSARSSLAGSGQLPPVRRPSSHENSPAPMLPGLAVHVPQQQQPPRPPYQLDDTPFVSTNGDLPFGARAVTSPVPEIADGASSAVPRPAQEVALEMPAPDDACPVAPKHQDLDADQIRRQFMDLSNRDRDGSQLATDFNTWQQAEAALRRGMTLERLVEKEFARTYSADAVERVIVVKDVGEVDKLVKKYDSTQLQLENLIDKWGACMMAGKPIKHATKSIKPAKLGESAMRLWGPNKIKVDKSEFLEWQLNDLYEQILLKQKEAMSKDSSAAFVTFRKRLTQVQASSALQYHDKTYWHTEAASGPQEIIWSNLTYRGWERSIRFILAWALFTAMLLFYTIPIVAIQAFLQIKYLEDLPGSDLLLGNVFIRSLIAGILPGLALTIFLALVPKLLRLINKVQGMYSEAGVDFEVGRKYYIFLYTQVFVITVLGGSLISNFKQLTDDSSQFVRSLGQTIPTAASFYMSYTLVQALISLPLKLLNIFPLLVFAAKASMAGSARGRRRLWARQYYKYGPSLPTHSLVVLFSLVFCVMYPMIAIPCVIYFAMASFVARYQLLYVKREAYQSGGCYQSVIYDQIVVALLTFQIVMFAVLSVKEFKFSFLLLIPIAASAIFNGLAGRTFKEPLGNLSAHAAADLDRADQDHNKSRVDVAAREAEMMRILDCEDTPLGRPEELYLPHCLTLSRSEHENTLDELDRARRTVGAVEAGGEVPPEMRAEALEDEDDHTDHVLKDTFGLKKGKSKQEV